MTGVARFQRDRIAALAQALQRNLALVDQCDDDLAGLRHLVPADDRGVAVQDAGFDHRIAGNLQCIMLAGPRNASIGMPAAIRPYSGNWIAVASLAARTPAMREVKSPRMTLGEKL